MSGIVRSVLFAVAVSIIPMRLAPCQGSQPPAEQFLLVAPNTNGKPGSWSAAIDHGSHNVGCGDGTVWLDRYYPIHGSLIPKGPYQGCVLVWDKGGDVPCRFLVNPATGAADIDVRWAIFDPRVTPPVVHKFAWRVHVTDAPTPPCNAANPPGHQGLFCGGHCWLPDGRLLVAGGDYWAQAFCGIEGFAGSRIVLVLDPNDIPTPAAIAANPALAHQLTNGPGPNLPWMSLSNQGLSVPGQLPIALAEARWYPSVVMMSRADLSTNGPANTRQVRIAVAGGVERYDANGTPPYPGDPAYGTYELLEFDLQTNTLSAVVPNGSVVGPATLGAGQLKFFYYPRLHYVSGSTPSPHGRLSMAGMVAQFADVDAVLAPAAWNNSGPVLALGSGNTLIEECCTVLMPPTSPAYRNWQVVMGGAKATPMHGSGVVTNEIFLFPTTAANPQWLPGPPMNLPRKFHNAVVLPDASILIIGGGTNIGHGLPGGGHIEPEIYWNGGWYLLSNQATERTYHSFAMLLPDGRVLSAGGDTCHDSAEYELFTPPYLQGSPARPRVLTTIPAVINYGQQLTLEVDLPFGQSVERVVLMRPGSVTHGQDPGQRLEPLPILPATNPTADAVEVTVQVPADKTLIPPGYCMLFLVSSAGVPSVATWVRLLP